MDALAERGVALTRVVPPVEEGDVVKRPVSHLAVFHIANFELLLNIILPSLQRQIRNEIPRSLVHARGVQDRVLPRGIPPGPASIPDNTLDVVLAVVWSAAVLRDGPQPVFALGVLVGRDNDIVPLRDSNVQHFRVIGHDGRQVRADDGELVPVDGELVVRVDGVVDKPDAVLFVFLKGGIEPIPGVPEDVGAVDEPVLGPGRPGGACCCAGVELVGGLVVPVAEGQDAEILVIGGRGGAPDDDTAKEAVPGKTWCKSRRPS